MTDLKFFIITLLLSIISIIFCIKFSEKFNFLNDTNYLKLQALHDNNISKIGGVCILVNILIICFFDFKVEFFILTLSFFLIGLFDDLKIISKPLTRLILCSFVLILILYNFEVILKTTGITTLDILIKKNEFFYIFFITLCFLTIINGSNFIDGINGNFPLHAIIIFIILSMINYFNYNEFLFELTLSNALILIVFLFFNLRNKIFLGDNGSYVIGAVLGYSFIETSNLNSEISPIVYVILSSYILFDIYFSSLRRLISRKSSVIADFNHLHSEFYKFFQKKNDLILSHILSSLSINLIYLILIFPIIFFFDSTHISFQLKYLLFIIAIFTTIYFFIVIANSKNSFKENIRLLLINYFILFLLFLIIQVFKSSL